MNYKKLQPRLCKININGVPPTDQPKVSCGFWLSVDAVHAAMMPHIKTKLAY